MWNDPRWRSLLHLLFVAITYGKVSLWLWKSLENSGNFFSYLVATLSLHVPENYTTRKHFNKLTARQDLVLTTYHNTSVYSCNHTDNNYWTAIILLFLLTQLMTGMSQCLSVCLSVCQSHLSVGVITAKYTYIHHVCNKCCTEPLGASQNI